MLVHIDLLQVDCITHLFFQFLKDRRMAFAGSEPFGKKIHQNRFRHGQLPSSDVVECADKGCYEAWILKKIRKAKCPDFP
jgi:hypothetical protein